MRMLIAGLCLYALATSAHGQEAMTKDVPHRLRALDVATRPIEVPQGMPETTKRIIVRANVQLTKQCPLLVTYWGDVVSARVTVNVLAPDWRDSDFRWEAHGWDRFLEYTIKFQGTLQQVPETVDAARHIAGHDLFFLLGGGRQPGIRMNKAGAQLLCGLQPLPSGNDLFIAVPDLKFVDGVEAPPQIRR